MKSDRLTYANTVVPEDHVVLLPLITHMKLISCGDYFVKKAYDGVALDFRDTNDCFDKARVEEQRLPSCHGVCTDERMLRDDWLPTQGTVESSRSFGLDL